MFLNVIKEIICEDDCNKVIYLNRTLGKLVEGVSFTVNGETMRPCDGFSIDFIIENTSRDVALHISPRLPQNYIIRNSKVSDTWGQAEEACALPFCLRPGTRFSIQILCTDDSYLIAVNGSHFCKFSHRLDYKAVRTLEIKGNILDVSLERKMLEYYPENVRLEKVLRSVYDADTADFSEDERTAMIAEQSRGADSHWLTDNSSSVLGQNASLLLKELKLPYNGKIRNNLFLLGRALTIEGRLRLLPQSFYINLQSGNNLWPHPIIALHLNLRFTKLSSGQTGCATVMRNSWLNGKWGEEEIAEMETAFRPGQSFSLSIVHKDCSFEIYVNRALLLTYKFRVNPCMIDTVYIQGDIKLFNVHI